MGNGTAGWHTGQSGGKCPGGEREGVWHGGWVRPAKRAPREPKGRGGEWAKERTSELASAESDEATSRLPSAPEASGTEGCMPGRGARSADMRRAVAVLLLVAVAAAGLRATGAFSARGSGAILGMSEHALYWILAVAEVVLAIAGVVLFVARLLLM